MKKRTIMILLCAISFILITFLVVSGNIAGFDDAIYEFIYQNHNEGLDFFFTHFTHIGDTIPVVIIALVIVCFLKSQKDRLHLVVALLTTVGVNQILKHVIARPRPPMERRLITQGGYSYPSGHSMVSLCVYGILLYFTVTKVKNKKLKVLLSVLLTIMILLIGISRIYVGVHYPSDVIGGYLLTIVILITTISMINYHFKGE